MAFSEEPDTTFTWNILEFENKINSFKTFISPEFTTSRDPNNRWNLILAFSEIFSEHCERCKSYEKGQLNLQKKRSPLIKDLHQNYVLPRFCISKVVRKVLSLEFISSESFGDKETFDHFKVEFSIINSSGRMFSRSFIINSDNKCYISPTFIDLEDVTKILSDGNLELLVEIFFPKLEKKKNNFENFLNAEFFSDVELSIGENKIPAHKVVLASKSPFFHEIFLEKKELNLNDINPEAFTEILKYIYTGEIENWSLTCEILAGASKLKIEDLKFKCEDRLRKNLSIESVIPILMVADESDAKSLKQHCLCYIFKNINEIGKCESFQTLKSEPGLVLEILREIFSKSSNEEIKIFDKIKLSKTSVATSRCCEFLKDYEPFLNSEILSDIEIHVGKKKFRSHKLILAARSSVFRGMLTNNMKEALSNLIEIRDLSDEVFEEMHRYMYTGKVENLSNLAIDILKAADEYDLCHLKNICEEFLNINLSQENVVNIVKISDTHNANFLKDQCIRYIVKDMVYCSKENKSVISLADFLETHSHILYELLEILCTLCCFKNTSTKDHYFSVFSTFE